MITMTMIDIIIMVMMIGHITSQRLSWWWWWLVMMITTSPGGSMGIETCSGVSFDSALRHACNHWILKSEWCNHLWWEKIIMKSPNGDYSRTSKNFLVNIFLLTWKMNIFGLMWSFGHWEASANMLIISLRSTPWWSRSVMICHHLSWSVMICHDLLWSVMIVMKSYHHWPFRHSRWFDQHWPPCAHEREHKQQATCNRSCWSGKMSSSCWTMMDLMWWWKSDKWLRMILHICYWLEALPN